MASSGSSSSVPSRTLSVPHLYRHLFPPNFIFGAASSAYQYEGAVAEGGRKPSIWDSFTKIPGVIKDGSDGNDAVKFYFKYEEDVSTMKELDLDAIRFSISWPRILPYGKQGGINQQGINFCDGLINELKDDNIEPFVTLFHWDLPQVLEDKFKGFLNPQIVEEFEYFADVCFENFGNRVKYWITMNEPWSFSVGGYASGVLAPGRCSPSEVVSTGNYSLQLVDLHGFLPPSRCSPTLTETEKNFAPPASASRFSSTLSTVGRNVNIRFSELLYVYQNDHGDSGREPYVVAHNQLLAHAAAVKLYREKYQKAQGGRIGITNVSILAVPYSENRRDKKAAERYNDFVFGWFIEPLIKGDYPDTMKAYVKDRLPRFWPSEEGQLKGSFDFLGINYYTARFARETTKNEIEKSGIHRPNYLTDHHVITSETNYKGDYIGDKGCPDWLCIYPKGIKDTILQKMVYIVESPWSAINFIVLYLYLSFVVRIAEYNVKSGIPTTPDVERMKYHYHHLCCVRQAIK